MDDGELLNCDAASDGWSHSPSFQHPGAVWPLLLHY